MIVSGRVLAELALAGLGALAGAVMSFNQAIHLDSGQLVFWILGVLLTVIALLLKAAWSDFRQRDRDGRQDRHRLFTRLEQVERELAVLQDRHARIPSATPDDDGEHHHDD